MPSCLRRLAFAVLPLTVGVAVAAEKAPDKAPRKAATPAATPASKLPEAAARPAEPLLPGRPDALQNLGVVGNTAAQGGVRTCLPRIEQMTNFLISGAQSGAMVFLAPANADQNLASVALEVLTPTTLSYVDTAYAPGPNATCSGTYEAVTYWNNNCDQVAAGAFAGFKRGSPLRQYVAVLDGGPSAKVFLMPAGPGCVSIKKEVLF